jgi:histone deacetylase 11
MIVQAGGSVLAGKLAVERGWAINLGGGFHHACAYMGTKGGYCIYADITMLIEFARTRLGIKR